MSEAIVPSQQHRFQYNEPMPVESCTQSLCDLALQFGEDDEEGGMVWFCALGMFTLMIHSSTACIHLLLKISPHNAKTLHCVTTIFRDAEPTFWGGTAGRGLG